MADGRGISPTGLWVRRFANTSPPLPPIPATPAERRMFALGHPEKMIDFGYRAVHEMTVQAKAIVAAYYGRGPQWSYWNGCSTGGRQGLMEAQRFPRDYNGIAAGAPAAYRSHLLFASMWIARATLVDPASYIQPSKYPMIHAAALKACDALDGITDGIIDDPTRCHFDPAVLTCNGADAADCLTPPQVEAAKQIYSSSINPRTARRFFPRSNRAANSAGVATPAVPNHATSASAIFATSCSTIRNGTFAHSILTAMLLWPTRTIAASTMRLILTWGPSRRREASCFSTTAGPTT